MVVCRTGGQQRWRLNRRFDSEPCDNLAREVQKSINPLFRPGATGKVLRLAPRLPVADFLQVAHGHPGEGQGVLIIRRAKFGCERGNPKAAPFLRLPDHPPPGLVRFQMPLIFRRARVGHLGPFLIAHARMDVQTALGALADDADLIFDQSFADANPMAEIAA